ncbi:uncharacterized protein LOC123016261 isoform X3 [Tribolium madens]|uniref:uncharacterized protein LOC123016261 isoform X3 n=1 Tax=Tribolium madens TaxID=41895 RepID=UPI001CF72C73|nr:uncharacterized protein LOC123016261 isoform X3 [Tribolium madens]
MSADRQSLAKKLLLGKGKDAAEQRMNRRQRLVQHFKSLRIETIDRFRRMSHDDLTYENLTEIKKCILSTLDTKDLIDDEEEMLQFIDDLDKEMTVLLFEQHEKETSEEIDSITNLMPKCGLCGDFVVQSEVCEACVEELSL